MSLSFTGFQILELAGGFQAGPYFQPSGVNGAAFTAPAGAVLNAPLSFPAGAASGKRMVPASALLAYGSAFGAALPFCPTGGV